MIKFEKDNTMKPKAYLSNYTIKKMIVNLLL